MFAQNDHVQDPGIARGQKRSHTKTHIGNLSHLRRFYLNINTLRIAYWEEEKEEHEEHEEQEQEEHEEHEED
eukprot:COSAG05_NODE_2474_length_3022_cov_2.143885_5_plen_72_part_00